MFQEARGILKGAGVMEKLNEADIKRIMNGFECHTHLGFPEKLYDEILAVGDAYLALREEEGNRRKFKTAMEANEQSMFSLWTNYCEAKERISSLEAESQALKGRYIQAINDEPELPGPMPEGMREDVLKDPEKAMRILVRATKQGILERIKHL